MKKPFLESMKFDEFDELYTPDYAVIPILKYIPKNVKVIWECTDYGKSNITKVLKQYGYEVITSHKRDFDFINEIASFHFDMIITNPPYTFKDDFITKCYEYGKPFALLLPLTALEGKYRNSLYRTHGMSLIVLDKRINFIGFGNTNYYNTSWYVHGIDEGNKLYFHELDTKM